MVGTLIAIGIAVGRLLWSWLLDFWSFRSIYWIMISSLVFLSITVHQIAEYGSRTLYAIWLFVIIMMQAGHHSSFCVAAMQIADQKWYIVFTAISCLSFASSYLIVYLIYLFLLPTLGYGYLILVLAILQCIPIALFPFFKGTEETQQLKIK
eukprot:TRINITY_DN11332_c0_g1_i1.p1 TRINITY_DN11332_c0_g1~~TRINITY_DN11332_c0_g1_i1.p1  ORF type:complete len:152 (+),score=0.28 TRINITY_DN11332_c0_g1_i1:75-530(+)